MVPGGIPDQACRPDHVLVRGRRSLLYLDLAPTASSRQSTERRNCRDAPRRGRSRHEDFRRTARFLGPSGAPIFAPPNCCSALTHGSISTATQPGNQRLEFLGDRVLRPDHGPKRCFAADRTATEGQLAPRYNALVKGEDLRRHRRGGAWRRAEAAGRDAVGRPPERALLPTPWRQCWPPSI